MATNAYDQIMQAWFPTDTHPERKPFTETDMRGIADSLKRTSNASWSRIPRIYSVLRIINQLSTINTFLAGGFSDAQFPFSSTSLPSSFRDDIARSDFLTTQHLVLDTRVLNLEKQQTGHTHFHNTSDVPLQKTGELGKGRHGVVDRVVSTVTHKEYARKLIPRSKTFGKNTDRLRSIERELECLKKMQKHKHVIELVASYTEPKYVGILTKPVAHYNMLGLLSQHLDSGKISFLRGFFGCLISALHFLHTNQVCHGNIKPQNVLVNDEHVFLTDFGLSLTWEESTDDIATKQSCSVSCYNAPELTNNAPRSFSADIWALGCVFLEMWTVLKGETKQSLDKHLRSTGTLSPAFYPNTSGTGLWIEYVKSMPGPEPDNVPTAWIVNMLQQDERERWTVGQLKEEIQAHDDDPSTPFAFTGVCCHFEDCTSESVHSFTNEEEDYTRFPLPLQKPIIGQSPPQPSVEDEANSLARETTVDHNEKTVVHNLPPAAVEDNTSCIDSPMEAFFSDTQDKPQHSQQSEPHMKSGVPEIPVDASWRSTEEDTWYDPPERISSTQGQTLVNEFKEEAVDPGSTHEGDCRERMKSTKTVAWALDANLVDVGPDAQERVGKIGSAKKDSGSNAKRAKKLGFKGTDTGKPLADEKRWVFFCSGSDESRNCHDCRTRDDLIQLPFDHRMCETCLQTKVSRSLKSPKDMPPRCCSIDIVPNGHLAGHLDTDLWNNWNRKYQEFLRTTSDFGNSPQEDNVLTCPKDGCNEWIVPSGIKTDSNTGKKHVKCTGCSTLVCLTCTKRFHTFGDCARPQSRQLGWELCWHICSECKNSRDKCQCGYSTNDSETQSNDDTRSVNSDYDPTQSNRAQYGSTSAWPPDYMRPGYLPPGYYHQNPMGSQYPNPAYFVNPSAGQAPPSFHPGYYGYGQHYPPHPFSVPWYPTHNYYQHPPFFPPPPPYHINNRPYDQTFD
jgi:serine/threonine protein kinase